jgi:hypothetical protein
MPAPAHILTKIQYLLNLGKSSTANEAASAFALAKKIIAKYGVTDQELESVKNEQKPYDNDNAIIFKANAIIGYKQQLALACAKQFFCYVVIETLVSAFGENTHTYYAYGEDEDIEYVKFAYSALEKMVNDLVLANCLGRGPRYIASYTEGVVEAIKGKIAEFGLDIPENKKKARPITQDEKTLNDGEANITPVKTTKQRPEKETTDVMDGSMISDIGAYFRGLQDGRDLSIDEILELAADNETVEELTEGAHPVTQGIQ